MRKENKILKGKVRLLKQELKEYEDSMGDKTGKFLNQNSGKMTTPRSFRDNNDSKDLTFSKKTAKEDQITI